MVLQPSRDPHRSRGRLVTARCAFTGMAGHPRMPEDADAPAARQGRQGGRFPALPLPPIASPNGPLLQSQARMRTDRVSPGRPLRGGHWRPSPPGALRLPCLRRSCLHVTGTPDGASSRPPRCVRRGFRWRKWDQCRMGFREGEKLRQKNLGFVVLATPPQPLPARGRGLSRFTLLAKMQAFPVR